MGDSNNLRVTGCPFIKCTQLPAHHRFNKKLSSPFVVVHERDVPDGTEVLIRAGNQENNVTEVVNYKAYFQGGVAKFNDLRFKGKSGRGKTFVVSIIIMTSPPQVASYENAIKVTVDGKREPRKQKAKNGYTSQGRRRRGYNSADNDRDSESIRSSSGSNDTSPRAKVPRRGSHSVSPQLAGFGLPNQNIHPVQQCQGRIPLPPHQLSQDHLLQYLAATRPPPVAHPLLSPLSSPLSNNWALAARQFPGGPPPPLNSLSHHHSRLLTPYSAALAASTNQHLQFQPPRAPPVDPALLNILNMATLINIFNAANTAQAHLSAAAVAANNNATTPLASGGIQIPAGAANSAAIAERRPSSSLSLAVSSASDSSPSTITAAASTSTSASSSSPATSAQAKANNAVQAQSNSSSTTTNASVRRNVLTSCATISTSSSGGNVGGKFSVDRLLKDK